MPQTIKQAIDKWETVLNQDASRGVILYYKSVLAEMFNDFKGASKSETSPESKKVYSSKAIKKAVEFGFRQNDKNGSINLNEQTEFIKSLK